MNASCKWVIKTTVLTVMLITGCFLAILTVMVKYYQKGPDMLGDIIGRWECVQFYKNQKSFLIPKEQKIGIIIDGDGTIQIKGSDNASILRGNRSGDYTIENGNILKLNMNEDDVWECPCVFTNDGLLRMTVPELEVILYLRKEGEG